MLSGNGNIPDGSWFSPDGGDFTTKGGTLYWNDGDVTTLKPGCVVRTIPAMHFVENPSTWTPEHRAEVRAETAKRRAQYQAEQAEDDARLNGHIESARAKLTDEEFEAVRYQDQ